MGYFGVTMVGKLSEIKIWERGGVYTHTARFDQTQYVNGEKISFTCRLMLKKHQVTFAQKQAEKEYPVMVHAYDLRAWTSQDGAVSIAFGVKELDIP